jgi:4-deoxy-L-threo-5-hexosulose-uronate ketol-isomerase
MDIRHPIHPEHGRSLDTAGLRRQFLIDGLFRKDELSLTYSHIDRIIVGGVVPARPVALEVSKKIIGSDYLLERRELGVLNLGESGRVLVEGKPYRLGRLEALYVGRGNKSVSFESENPAAPARFYMACGMAHRSLPTFLIDESRAKKLVLGSQEECNRRTIRQLVHPDVVESCNLVMGYTRLEAGSVWNTMPAHTHERRMEVYLYFDVPKDALVFHLMGDPAETRHIVMRNEQAVISPSWSIHSGVGTKNYSFVWAMVGENQTFTDMDGASMDAIF